VYFGCIKLQSTAKVIVFKKFGRNFLSLGTGINSLRYRSVMQDILLYQRRNTGLVQKITGLCDLNPLIINNLLFLTKKTDRSKKNIS